MKRVRVFLVEARKAAVAVAGVAAQAIALGVLSGRALDYATAVVSVATALGVYAVPNGGKHAAP